jgi:hypothetical protein
MVSSDPRIMGVYEILQLVFLIFSALPARNSSDLTNGEREGGGSPPARTQRPPARPRLDFGGNAVFPGV